MITRGVSRSPSNIPVRGAGDSKVAGYLGPSLLLDFAQQRYAMGVPTAQPQGKTFAELVTFSRSTGAGRFNAAGQYEWLAANEPRFDYDPVTLQPRGLLVEEQRTNLLTYSDGFDNAAWSKAGATVVPGVWDKLVEDTSAGIHAAFRTYGAGVVGQAYSYSIRVKAAERSTCYVRFGIDSTFAGAKFDLTTGAASEVTPGLTAVAVRTLDGGFRCTISRTATTTANVQVYIYVSQVTGYTGDGASGILISAAQLEVGAFPTSYIPTTTAQVTRGAELVQVATLSPWFNPLQGALIGDVLRPMATPSSQFVACFNDNSTAQRIGLFLASTNGNPGIVFTSASDAIAASAAGKVLNSGKLGLGYGQKNITLYALGESLNSVPTTGAPAVTRLEVGSVANFARLNGHIKTLYYWPRKMKPSELIARTL